MQRMNYYELLGIEVTATVTQIKAAYRKKAKEHHPDHGGDPEVFKSIQQAYETLIDPDERAFYDRTGAAKGSDIMNKVASMIREALNNPNPIKAINVGIRDARADCNIRIRQLSEKRVRLEKVLEKITTQNSSHKLYPVFVGVIRAELASAEEQQKSFELGIAEIAQLEKMFAGLVEDDPWSGVKYGQLDLNALKGHMLEVNMMFNKQASESEYSNNPDDE